MELLAFEQAKKVLGSVRTELVQPNHCCLRLFMARLSDFRSATNHYSMNAFHFSISSTRISKGIPFKFVPIIIVLAKLFSIQRLSSVRVSGVVFDSKIATDCDIHLHILLLFFTWLNRPSEQLICDLPRLWRDHHISRRRLVRRQRLSIRSSPVCHIIVFADIESNAITTDDGRRRQMN